MIDPDLIHKQFPQSLGAEFPFLFEVHFHRAARHDFPLRVPDLRKIRVADALINSNSLHRVEHHGFADEIQRFRRGTRVDLFEIDAFLRRERFQILNGLGIRDEIDVIFVGSAENRENHVHLVGVTVREPAFLYHIRTVGG